MEEGFIIKTNNHEKFIERLIALEKADQNEILIAVTHALLDLIEKQDFQSNNTIIMKTGGMKDRRKEIICEELHEIQCKA